MKLLLYCTKSRYRLFYDFIDNKYRYGLDRKKDKFNAFNGKIVAECDFEVEEIKSCRRKERDEFGILHNESWLEYRGLNIGNYQCDLPQKSCLTVNEIMDYLYNGGYAIHIKNLNIFDKPRELNEYADNKGYNIKKAPQNMMYADYINIEQNIYRPYILISIKPEWLCKILNGEKTIEVRKKVLKEMITDA